MDLYKIYMLNNYLPMGLATSLEEGTVHPADDVLEEVVRFRCDSVDKLRRRRFDGGGPSSMSVSVDFPLPGVSAANKFKVLRTGVCDLLANRRRLGGGPNSPSPRADELSSHLAEEVSPKEEFAARFWGRRCASTSNPFSLCHCGHLMHDSLGLSL